MLLFVRVCVCHGVTAFQIRKTCWAELQIIASSGCMNPRGLLHAGLALASALLKPHVVLMESINSLLGRVAGESPNISLELLSARVGVKKALGFTMGPAVPPCDEPNSETPACTEAAATQGPACPGQRPKTTYAVCARVQPKLVSFLSMKRIRPHAAELARQLLPFLADSARLVQNIERWTCPPPLRSFAAPNSQLLNAQDRPFSCLPASQKRLISTAQYFHKQWFNHHREEYVGKLTLVSFCTKGGTRLRAKTPLSDSFAQGLVRAFLVAEVHSRQAGSGSLT